MQTIIADERVLVFKDQINKEEAQRIAWDKKLDAFGAIVKLTSFLSKPKDEEFKVLYSEHRYQPIWHVKGSFKYLYDRTTTYSWQVSGPEVKTITIHDTDYTVANGKFAIDVLDHCLEEDQLEVLVDGLTGDKKPQLNKYLSFIANQVEKADLQKFSEQDIIILPPKARVSALINEILANSVKVIQADKIFEEKIEISSVDLYYRPIYAFEIEWTTKQKKVVIEVDALTSEVTFGNELFKEFLGKSVDLDFLFDIGADAAGMILPGGSIAVKLAKKYIDKK